MAALSSATNTAQPPSFGSRSRHREPGRGAWRAIRQIAAAGVVAAVLITACPAHAQDKDTLWTKVSAQDRVVALTWDKNHPWDAALSARGAQLIARYFVDANREVSEPIGVNVARSGDQRTLRFPLPESLRANPAGPVCLFIQLPDRRVLPVRRASNGDADTVGFRYAEWERQVRQVGEARAAQERVAADERAVAVSTRSVAGQQASLTQRGWTDLASCDQVAAPSALLGPRPFDIVDPAEQDNVARQVCVNRVVVGYLVNQDFIGETLPKLLANSAASQNVEKAREALSAVFSSAFAGPPGVIPPSLVSAVIARLGDGNGTVKARQAQAEAFIRDWMKWTPTLKNYTPQLGTPDDDLGWPSTATASAFRLFGPDLAAKLQAEWATQGMPAGTERDLEAFLGSALDAYSGCIEDSTKQLKTKFDNWEALRSNAPQRAASAREFLVRECRQEVGLLQKMRTESATLQEQLTRDRQALTTASAPAPLAAKPEELNLVSCAQRR